MGASFTSVQVRAVDTGVLMEALRAEAVAAGMVESAAGERSDREVVIAPPADGWVAIYDQATEQQDLHKLAALAALAARTARSHAVAILLHDSDVLELQLFNPDGAQVDRMNSAPGYFGRASAADRANAAGHAERWQPVLAAGRAARDLEKAWRGKQAEQILHDTARVVGLPCGRAETNQRYLTRFAIEPSWTRLRFRRAAPAPWEVPATGAPLLAGDRSSARHARALRSSSRMPGTTTPLRESLARRRPACRPGQRCHTRRRSRTTRASSETCSPSRRSTCSSTFAAARRAAARSTSRSFPTSIRRPQSRGAQSFASARLLGARVRAGAVVARSTSRRVSHLDEEDDSRSVRRSFRVDQRGDQVELTGEDVELVRLPAPQPGLEEGAGFGYTGEGSSGCGEVVRLGRVSATLIEVGRYRWYLDSRSCEEAQARSAVNSGGPCKR